MKFPAKEVKERIANLGLTQAEAAKLAEIPSRSCSDYLSGRVQPPFDRAVRLLEIARIWMRRDEI